jgi:hypothetical protein
MGNYTTKKHTEVKMSKQRAVEWLALQLPIGLRESFIKEIEHALQMERENKIEFAKKCLDKALDLDIRTAHSKVGEYYNQTYGGQDEQQ